MSHYWDFFERLLELLRKLLERLRKFEEEQERVGSTKQGLETEENPPGSGLPPDTKEVPRGEVDLRDDPSVLSPPIVTTPLYACAVSVTVIGFVPHAELDLEIDGAIVATQVDAGFPEPQGFTFPLAAPLAIGQVVRARQRHGGAQSLWSTPVTVGDHTQDFPAGPPRPQVDPAPVHECGARTGVANLLQGSRVWITADGTQVGEVKGAKEHQGVNVTPDYGLGQDVVAHTELCGDHASPSQTHVTQPPPSPLPTPAIDDVYDGGEQIRVTALANGARFTIERGGTNLGTWRTWGQAHLVGLSPPFTAGETLKITQRLCASQPESPAGTTTVLPCSELPAPKIAAIQGGDTVVHVLEFVPDARIKVFKNGVKVGDGGGAWIQLTTSLEHGDVVHVFQEVGTCVGSTVVEVETLCVSPQAGPDPSGLDVYPVGITSYDGGTTDITGGTHQVKGIVYYPADSDGKDQPFHGRLGGLGPVPIVFMAHGNHATWRNPNDHSQESCGAQSGWEEIPNHEGYDYLQRALARMGIISVGVYSNETNCTGYSATNMVERAELILASIDHFATLNTTAGHRFQGHVDLQRIGLLGHSRGGEAVVVLPEIIPDKYGIRAVLSLAPTNAGASSGRPRGHAFMTILPAGDGDVRSNPGAMYYDQCDPSPFKSQLYVHHANHNYFNRHWPHNEGVGSIMARHEHESILLRYGCAFYRRFLLSHGAQEAYLTGRVLPPATRTENVHLSWEHQGTPTVDHHEDGNGIGTNSLGQPTSQSGLMADEYPFRQGGGAFNGSFYGNTIGMVASVQRAGGLFRSSLPSGSSDFGKSESVLVRVAEVYDLGGLPMAGVTFDVGLEDSAGVSAWVAADDVGGVPRPYERPDYRKTMLKTLRFPLTCFRHQQPDLNLGSIRAVLLRSSSRDRNLAFDVLQIRG